MIRNNIERKVKKPCPFCGGEAVREIDRDDDHPNLYHCSITCTQCTANISLLFAAPDWLKWPDQAAARFISKAWDRREGCGKPARKGSGGKTQKKG